MKPVLNQLRYQGCFFSESFPKPYCIELLQTKIKKLRGKTEIRLFSVLRLNRKKKIQTTAGCKAIKLGNAKTGIQTTRDQISPNYSKSYP